nr:hypothetical protein [Tanacetum cinerariifolium]
ETEDEEEYMEDTIQDAIMIAAAKTSCIWSYLQDETEDEEEYVEETLQDTILIVAAKTSFIWSYLQGMKVYAFIIMLVVCTLGLGPGCIFTLIAISKWECSSYGRALALHARGTGFDSPHFYIFSLCV